MVVLVQCGALPVRLLIDARVRRFDWSFSPTVRAMATSLSSRRLLQWLAVGAAAAALFASLLAFDTATTPIETDTNPQQSQSRPPFSSPSLPPSPLPSLPPVAALVVVPAAAAAVQVAAVGAAPPNPQWAARLVAWPCPSPIGEGSPDWGGAIGSSGWQRPPKICAPSSA